MNKYIILIFGLPGSGKSTLAKELAYHFCLPHYNADTLREFHDDWDFSEDGRHRQLKRMKEFKLGIVDFVCPFEKYRNDLNSTFSIYMDTIEESRYEDTNKAFEKPKKFDIRITQWIGQNQLHNSLADFNPGTKGIQSYLNGPFQKLVK